MYTTFPIRKKKTLVRYLLARWLQLIHIVTVAQPMARTQINATMGVYRQDVEMPVAELDAKDGASAHRLLLTTGPQRTRASICRYSVLTAILTKDSRHI